MTINAPNRALDRYTHAGAISLATSLTTLGVWRNQGVSPSLTSARRSSG